MLRHIVVGNGILIVQYAFSALIPLLMVPHIVRYIGVEKFGAISVAIAAGSLASVVVQYAFQLTGPKRLAQPDPGDTSGTVLVETLVAKALLLAGVLPVVALAAILLPFSFMSGELLLALFGLPIAGALNSSWFLIAKGRIFPLSSMTIAASLIGLSIGFRYVTGEDGVSTLAAVVALTCAPLLTGLGTLLVSWALAERDSRGSILKRALAALHEGWPLFASQFVSRLYSTSGPIVVGFLAGLSAAGAYSAVERVVNAVVGACLLTHTVAYPKLAAMYNTDRAAYRRLLTFVLITYLSIAGSVAVVAWVLRDLLLTSMYDNSPYITNELLAWSLLWLIIGVFGSTLTGYLTVSGRASKVLPLTAKVLSLSFALGVPGALIFGGTGWMAALVLSQLIVLATAYKYWRLERADGHSI